MGIRDIYYIDRFIPLSTYFPFSRTAGLFLILSPGVGWLIAIILALLREDKSKEKTISQEIVLPNRVSW